MLTKVCPRCDGKGAEPGWSDGRACIGCKGKGSYDIPEDPVPALVPSTSDGLMTIDPPPDPKKKAARKLASEPCGKCKCCRRWKAKAYYTNKGSRAAVAKAQGWADYWKRQYETLSAARTQDHPTKKGD